MLRDDGTTDLDHGELLRGNRGEVGEVLLDLALGADVAQQLDDGGPCRIGTGRVTAGLEGGGGQRGRRASERRTSSSGSGPGSDDGLLRGEVGERRCDSSPHEEMRRNHSSRRHAAAWSEASPGGNDLVKSAH